MGEKNSWSIPTQQEQEPPKKFFPIEECELISDRIGVRTLDCDDVLLILGGRGATSDKTMASNEEALKKDNQTYKEITMIINDKLKNSLHQWAGSKDNPVLSLIYTVLPVVGRKETVTVSCVSKSEIPVNLARCELLIDSFVNIGGVHNWPKIIKKRAQPEHWRIPLPGTDIRVTRPCGVLEPTNYQCNKGQISWTFYNTKEEAIAGQEWQMKHSKSVKKPDVEQTLKCHVNGKPTTCIRHILRSSNLVIVSYRALTEFKNIPTAIVCSMKTGFTTDPLGELCSQIISLDDPSTAPISPL